MARKAAKRVPRAVREQEMLDVAERVFAERGYDGTSMDEIARGAGISKPMVYAYFGSKQGLYLALVERAGRKLFETVGQASSTGPPDRRLWAGIVAYFQFVEEYRDGWRILYRESAGGGEFEERLESDRSRFTDLIVELFAKGVEDAGFTLEQRRQTESFAHAFVGACEAIGRRWLQHPEEPKELQALRIMNFAWIGLRGLLEGDAWWPEEWGPRPW